MLVCLKSGVNVQKTNKGLTLSKQCFHTPIVRFSEEKNFNDQTQKVLQLDKTRRKYRRLFNQSFSFFK